MNATGSRATQMQGHSRLLQPQRFTPEGRTHAQRMRTQFLSLDNFSLKRRRTLTSIHFGAKGRSVVMQRNLARLKHASSKTVDSLWQSLHPATKRSQLGA